jgi:hypothetical protein
MRSITFSSFANPEICASRLAVAGGDGGASLLRSVARHFGVHFHGPRINAAGEIRHVGKALLEQPCGGARGTSAVVALNEEGLRFFGELFQRDGGFLRRPIRPARARPRGAADFFRRAISPRW